MSKKTLKLKPEFKGIHKWEESHLDDFRLGILITDSIKKMNEKPYDEINILFDNHIKAQLIHYFPDEILEK